MTVTTSFVVRLGDGDEAGLLKAEIDRRPDGFNGGRTQFLPGDAVHYLVYTGAKTVITKHESTLGAISSLGLRTRPVEDEDVSFVDARSARLDYPVAGGLSVAWMGQSPGMAQLRGDNELVLSAAALGIATVSYTTRFQVFRLANLPGLVNGRRDYSVLVRLAGEVG